MHSINSYTFHVIMGPPKTKKTTYHWSQVLNRVHILVQWPVDHIYIGICLPFWETKKKTICKRYNPPNTATTMNHAKILMPVGNNQLHLLHSVIHKHYTLIVLSIANISCKSTFLHHFRHLEPPQNLCSQLSTFLADAFSGRQRTLQSQIN